MPAVPVLPDTCVLGAVGEGLTIPWQSCAQSCTEPTAGEALLPPSLATCNGPATNYMDSTPFTSSILIYECLFSIKDIHI